MPLPRTPKPPLPVATEHTRACSLRRRWCHCSALSHCHRTPSALPPPAAGAGTTTDCRTRIRPPPRHAAVARLITERWLLRNSARDGHSLAPPAVGLNTHPTAASTASSRQRRLSKRMQPSQPSRSTCRAATQLGQCSRTAFGAAATDTDSHHCQSLPSHVVRAASVVGAAGTLEPASPAVIDLRAHCHHRSHRQAPPPPSAGRRIRRGSCGTRSMKGR